MKIKYIIFTLLIVITLTGVSGWYFWPKSHPVAEKQTDKVTNAPKLDCSGGITKEGILSEINRERVRVGSSPVLEDLELTKIAQERAIKLDGAMDSHVGFHQLVKDRILPLKYLNFGENLAVGSCNSKGYVDGWMTSKLGHRETMLNPKFDHIGIGYYKSLAVTIYGESR